MNKQNTSHILMIRPVAFGFNTQTAGNNHYQQMLKGISASETQQLAQKEFDDFAKKLRTENVDITIIEDTIEPPTPDSIFPNNWVSFHSDGTVILYPMFAPNRRSERRTDVLEILREKGFLINKIVDFSDSEKDNLFLEGTGSLVLDRGSKIAYACISLRTDKTLLEKWATRTNYEVVSFSAEQQVDEKPQPIYHTNVMMSVGKTLAVICSNSIKNEKERKCVLSKLVETGKQIIRISEQQKANFAGNMLQVINSSGQSLMVMSTQALESLTTKQIADIKNANRIVHSSLKTIETLGGGSARCMMAEVFLPYKRSIR